MNNTTNTATSQTLPVYKKRGQGAEIWRRFRQNKNAMVGMCIFLVLVSFALFAEFIAPYDPIEQDLLNIMQTPSRQHILGTDELGRDIFSRIVYGSRISMTVGLIAVGIAFVAGSALGVICGYYGGILDNVIMRFVDILMSIPAILLNISIVAALGTGLQNVMIAIGISNVPRFCRIIRASVMSLREQEFVEASRAAGAKDLYIVMRHIIPNCLAPLIIQATVSIGSSILQCASLSFIGLGIVPPTPEWGAMLSTGRDFLRKAPHLTTFPGLAIMAAVYAMNLMGDGLRDALDPKLKN